jgi:hypothetical protein
VKPPEAKASGGFVLPRKNPGAGFFVVFPQHKNPWHSFVCRRFPRLKTHPEKADFPGLAEGKRILGE